VSLGPRSKPGVPGYQDQRAKTKAANPELYNGYDPTEAKVDGSLHSLETPESMLKMIGFMTKNIGDHV
jgi:hypothetical protein